jgi:hypothetical protein
VLERTQKRFGAELIDHYEGSITQVDEGRSSNVTLEGLQKVVVDNYLLSKCDHIVVTAWSTFGALASARSALVPLLVAPGSHCKLVNLERAPGGVW